MKALVCTCLAAILFYLSQGMADFWWLAWVAASPLLWFAYDEQRGWAAAVPSLIGFSLGQTYLFQCYGYLIPPLIIAAQVLILALMFTAAILFGRLVYRRMGAAPALIAFPACWTGLEYLWGSVSPNGTFAALAYSQVSAPVLIQVASIFGLAAITFLVCLFANAIALSLGRETPFFVPAAGITICLLNLLFGAVELHSSASQRLRVAALAGSAAPQTSLGAPTRATDIKQAQLYAAAIRDAAAKGARVAVTGEGSILTDRQWRADVLEPLAASAKAANIEIVAGVVQRDPAADSAITFHSDRQVQDYDKRHLVPGLDDAYSPGKRAGLLGRSLATVICKDMDFPQTIRSDAAQGIRIMFVPAGDFVRDGWIHARMAMLRGVENGFAVVRSANDGLITVSDAQGRIEARASDHAHGIYGVVADASLGPGATLYTRIGDIFAWLSLLVTALLLVQVRTRSVRRAHSQEAEDSSKSLERSLRIADPLWSSGLRNSDLEPESRR